MLHGIILAIIQGLTEFLPVSSSAHLILVPYLLHWSDQGLAFDVAIHVGTLFAVLIYFRKELREVTIDWLHNLRGGPNTANSRLGWAIGFGTVPVGIAGLLFNNLIATYARSVWLIAINTVVFGVLLGVVTWFAKQRRDEWQLNWRDVSIIGCAQALALLPGVSRSGITLTAGLMVGLTRSAAARYSFLLSIPVILLAGGLQGWKLWHEGVAINYSELAICMLIAGLSGYACIDLFLRLIERFGVMPFVVYRILLGCLLLIVI